MLPSIKRPNIFLLILLLAPFVKPVILESYPLLNTLFTLWKLLALAILFIFLLPRYLMYHPKKNMLGLFGLIIFWAIYCANCFFSNIEFASTLAAACASLLCFLLIAYEAQIGNGWTLLQSMSVLFCILILAHVCSVFLLPILPSTVFFLGMDNYSAFFIYPMLSIILFYHSLRYNKLRWFDWLLALLVVFLYLYTASYTAAATGLVYLVFLLFYSHYHKLPKIRGVRWLIPLFVALLVLIMRFQIQNLIAGFLNSTDKGITLNSRTVIWDHALDLISEAPFFGHGSFSATQIADYVLYGTNHAHNILLELLMRTGIVGTIAYLLFLCGFIPTFQRGKSDNRHSFLLLSSLIAQLVLSFMDYYPSITVFYMFMAVLYYRDYFTPEPPKRKIQL